jgi:dienelactone hydrolase
VTDPPKVFFRDPSYDGQLVRTLAAATVGAADLGEAMAAARQVGKLSGSSWYETWSRTAERARSSAETALAAGDRVTAREGFLRASEYYRQAYYFIRSNLDDRRLREAYRRHVETFRAAASLMNHPAEAVRIPYEDTALAGYLFSPDASGEARPTILHPCGYDSTAEAGWANAPAGLQRGYNVLVFEGPGQGEALFTQRLYFRPDFEHVLTPVIDWLVTRAEVDPDALVLVGRSFAGYLAPRAATVEHRLAALVCDPAQPDMADRLPEGLAGKLAVPVVKAQMAISADRAEFFGARMAGHGIHSVDAYFQELRRFTMLDDAHRITCPTLIIEADHDFAGGSGQTLCDAMSAPAQLVRLTESEGADGHCAGLGQTIWAETVYAWLRQTLASVTDDADRTSNQTNRKGEPR